jgi:hypothetical protein
MPGRSDRKLALGGSAVERVFYGRLDWERQAASPEIALTVRLGAGMDYYVPPG